MVDASVWVSYLVEGDANHAASERWLDAWLLDGGEVIAPRLVLAEPGGAIARRAGASATGIQAVTWLRRVPAVRLLDLDTASADRAADVAAGLRLRGADAVYVALASHLGVPLVTWAPLLERAAPHVPAMTLLSP